MTVRVDMARTVPAEPGAKPGSAVGSALVATGGDNAIAPPWPLSSILGPLGALPTAPGLARRYIYVVLAGWGLSAMTADAEIIASELTTNVVMAATRPDGMPAYDDQGRLPVVWLCLLSDRHWLLIQAWDNLPEVLGAPVARRAGPDDETGRGLEITESLSEQWGWETVPGWRGKCVWALLRAELGTQGTCSDAH
jgi:hypothetical protein